MILDRYILKLWLPSFLGFFLVINVVLLFGRLMRAIQIFGDNPIDVGILAEMLFSILPYFVILTLPFSFFFALLKVFSYLQQNSESDALLAAGVSPFRLMRPMFVLSIIFWVFLTWTATEWMPAGQRTFYQLYYSVKNTTALPDFTPGQFSKSFDELTIYHSGEDKNGEMQHFMLEDKRTSPPTIYIAQRAKISRAETFLVLNMYDGVLLDGKGEELKPTYFETFSLAVDVEGLGNIQRISSVSQLPSFLSMQSLNEKLKNKETTVLLAEWHRRWLLPTTIFVLFLFALPLSKNSKRSGKSKGWIWGVVLVLIIYNVQIVLHKKVALGQLDVMAMWLGQLGFALVGLILFTMFSRLGGVRKLLKRF